MSTYRERRLAKADRLEGWAEAREARQPALSEAARADEAATGIPFGQPILVGHHSERRHRRAIERIDRNMRTAVENSAKAASMSSRAESIRAAADRAIYDDDPDAVERLQAKLEQLEAKRERIKAYNATCRKRAKIAADPRELEGEHLEQWKADMLAAKLTRGEVRDLTSTIRVQAWQCPGGRFPAYVLQNLGGQITTTRQRIARLSQPVEAEHGRTLTARYPGECRKCGRTLERGETVRYFRRAKAVECGEGCPS